MSMRAKHFYEFGHFRLDTVERLLIRDGQPLNLAPKVYETLLILVRNHGHALDKKELMRELWPETFVEEGNLTQNISLLRKALGDGREEHYIETIPRRGYRFVAVVVERCENGTEPASAPQQQEIPGGGSRRPRWAVTVSAGLAIIVLCGLVYWGIARRHIEDTAVRSLAILPLRDLSQTSNNEYLAEGIAEALVTQLARIRDLRVVSFSRTRRFKGSSPDAAEIGRQLGVDAVLEGTVRAGAGRLRMTVHLVQARTGFELWADDRLEGSQANLLDTQQHLAQNIAQRLRGQLTPAERDRIATPGTANMEAYELLLRGKQLVTRSAPVDYAGGTPSQMEIGRRMLERAIELDPDFADAHAWLAYGLLNGRPRSERTRPAATIAANRALSLNPNSPVALMAKVTLETARGRAREALALGKRVLDANPEDLDAIAAAAEAYFYAGMLDRAIPLYRKALAADPSNLQFRNQLTRSYLYSGEYQKGVDWLTPELEVRDMGIWAMNLYTELGRFQKAMEVADLSTRNLPDQYVGWYFAGCIFANAGRPERARQIWLNGVRHTEDQLARAEHRGPRTFLGLMYAKLGMRKKALENAQRVLALNPDHSEVLYFVCKIHAILGDRREAIDYLKQAIAKGFLTLGYVDYHRRPHMGLHNLDEDPEFQGVRDDLAKKIEQLRVQ
jgi:TolB-like protein/DNA-binding winged helix-turn-helix (wHTH) protein